jgi:hypothetical protein
MRKGGAELYKIIESRTGLNFIKLTRKKGAELYQQRYCTVDLWSTMERT